MDTVIKLVNVSKEYRYGVIGTGSLNADFQSWWARKRGKEDPNQKIGAESRNKSGTFLALNNINMEVQRGEALGIIGANGAGKSTLLKLLSRITTPSEGDIYIKGKIASMLEVGTGFHPELTGLENIYMNGSILGMTSTEIDEKLDKIIAFSEVEEFINTPVKRYSSGMYVKLAFSVAAHLDSDILIMDEVLAVGDARFQEKCIRKMKSIINDEGRTVLFVSHGMSAIRQMCTRCIILERGAITFNGDVALATSKYLMLGNEDPKEEKLTLHYSSSLPKTSLPLPLSVSLMGEDGQVVSEGQPVMLRMRWRPPAGQRGTYRLRIVVSYYDSSHTGLSLSEVFSARGQEEVEETIFALPTNRLSGGRYYIDFDILDASGTELGAEPVLLTVADKFNFIVSDEDHATTEEEGYWVPAGNWNHESWGHVALPRTQVLP